jgi:hypothetical protein
MGFYRQSYWNQYNIQKLALATANWGCTDPLVCWEYAGEAREGDGVGVITVHVYASGKKDQRIACKWFYNNARPESKGMHVYQACGNKKCIKLEHMFACRPEEVYKYINSDGSISQKVVDKLIENNPELKEVTVCH